MTTICRILRTFSDFTSKATINNIVHLFWDYILLYTTQEYFEYSCSQFLHIQMFFNFLFYSFQSTSVFLFFFHFFVCYKWEDISLIIHHNRHHYSSYFSTCRSVLFVTLLSPYFFNLLVVTLVLFLALRGHEHYTLVTDQIDWHLVCHTPPNIATDLIVSC